MLLKLAYCRYIVSTCHGCVKTESGTDKNTPKLVRLKCPMGGVVYLKGLEIRVLVAWTEASVLKLKVMFHLSSSQLCTLVLTLTQVIELFCPHFVISVAQSPCKDSYWLDKLFLLWSFPSCSFLSLMLHSLLNWYQKFHKHQVIS